MQPRKALFLSLMTTNCSGERSFSRFKRIKNELKGRNVPWEVVRTKHSIRGVTRLDGARGQEASLSPRCSNLRSFWSNVLYWRRYLWHCWDFFSSPAVISRPPPWCAPRSDSAPGELCLPCPPPLRPCIRYIKSDKLRQTNCNEFLHNFVMRKAGQNPFNCLLCYINLTWFDDCSF